MSRGLFRRRDVILHEMEEVEGQTEEVVFDRVHATAFQYASGNKRLSPFAVQLVYLHGCLFHFGFCYKGNCCTQVLCKHEDIVEQVKKLLRSCQQIQQQLLIWLTRTCNIPQAQRPRFSGFNGHAVYVWVLGISAGGGKHMGSVPDCLDDLSMQSCMELTKLCYRVSKGDVIRAVTSPVAEDIGRRCLHMVEGSHHAELFARIDSVDASTDLAITAVGPIQGHAGLQLVQARRTYWLRY
ncbi:hypothetical protein DH2020_048837 [Rehmannia glutinosa]|uniref:Uncharacterized protein n=1 Tax=Rehmannia glutinosa TaxID=99300 RepID=A0ABR0U4J4_REHGL